MTIETVHPDLIKVALDKVDGFAFERFAQDFLSAFLGQDFIPLGGVYDGGADGIYECKGNRVYYQFTRQENHRDKIRKTVERLHGFKREFNTLYYLSSRVIPNIDKEEDLLSNELNVTVKIRDNKYISSHINDCSGTKDAFKNHLMIYTEFLGHVSRSNAHHVSSHVSDPSAYVFLQHEVADRLGNRKLVHSLTDTMIFWALSDTDPEKDILMTEDQIRERIFDQFPWASKLLKAHIPHRLIKLRTKNNSKREITWYKKDKKYCLPYATRSIIKQENQSDEALKINFIDELRLLASGLFDADDGEYQTVAELSRGVINVIFEKQGLLFSHFLSSEEKNEAPQVITDCIDTILVKAGIKKESIEQYRDYIETIIKNVFYHSSPNQREYLTSLSRTYVLLFMLQAEPRIIEYFSTMSASFKLFLGSDIIVKAISERYLSNENQVARNLLKMTSASGSSMYLSECVLDEVYTHIKGTYYEFKNYFEELEHHITMEIAMNSEKILIRSYFYAKQAGHINNWISYLDQFITYSNIDKPAGKDELKRYLMSEYKLIFMENSDLESLSQKNAVRDLADAMLASDDKENEALAYNTALQVHGIYGLRSKNKETATSTEYGLETWWMTNQTRVLKHTTNIIKEKHAKYIMRPEFILNFIAMSPNCAQIRDSFKTIFPSIFGIQLGHRLRNEDFHAIMSQVRQWKNYEPGRITVLMSNLSDKLKADRLKRYNHNLDDEQL